jgi:LysR family glycine cleavage system transcriptional activator
MWDGGCCLIHSGLAVSVGKDYTRGMSRLPFQSIEAFVVVARSLSLTAASTAMNLTVPALSRRIQILEQHLGVRLFRRLPRGLSLTEAGAAYFRAVEPGWEAVREATEAARVGLRRGPIRVSVMPTFAANWLMPRLARLPVRAGGMEVALETSSELVDLHARPDLDCAIRLGAGPWTGLVSQAFLPVDAYVVASPGFLRDNGPLRHPGDVLRHLLIGSHHQPDFWREWFQLTGIDAEGCRYRSFDNLHVAYEATAAGMGVALGLDPVVRPYLDSGRLERVFPDNVRSFRSFHLVVRPGGSRPLDRFRDWLFAEAG